jgi:hypothetical protein
VCAARRKPEVLLMDGPLACWSAPKAPSSFLAPRLHLLFLLRFRCFYFPPFVSAPLALSRPDRSCPSWQVAIRMLQGRKCASGCRLVVPSVGLGKKAFLVAAILETASFSSSFLTLERSAEQFYKYSERKYVNGHLASKGAAPTDGTRIF